MSSANRYLPHYTQRDYEGWDGDWELWQGIPVAITPSPFGGHSRVLVSAATELKAAVGRRGCDATVLAELDWIIADNTIVRPDLMVICGREPPRHLESRPDVVVEILSDSTRDRDVDHKRTVYQSQRVPYYLMLDPDRDQLTALRLESSGAYVDLPPAESLDLSICDECRLELSVHRLFH